MLIRTEQKKRTKNIRTIKLKIILFIVEKRKIMGDQTFKHFIRELVNSIDIDSNASISVKNFLEGIQKFLKYNHSFELDCEYNNVNDKISAILRCFLQVERVNDSIELTKAKIISLLRKSKEHALRTRWSSVQISEAVNVIDAGISAYDTLSTDDEKDSNNDSAFSSDDN